MSDIIEDTKVHYIVSDYKRMYDGFHALVKENKELRKQNEELKQKVEHLHSELGKKAETKKCPNKKINGVLNEIEARANAACNELRRRIDSLNGIIENAEEIRTFLSDQ